MLVQQPLGKTLTTANGLTISKPSAFIFRELKDELGTKGAKSARFGNLQPVVHLAVVFVYTAESTKEAAFSDKEVFKYCVKSEEAGNFLWKYNWKTSLFTGDGTDGEVALVLLMGVSGSESEESPIISSLDIDCPIELL